QLSPRAVGLVPALNGLGRGPSLPIRDPGADQGPHARDRRDRAASTRDMSRSPAASIQHQFRTIDGLQIRYADSGGSQEQVVLLTSPWPESIYAFAPMWSKLAGHA